ncbi:MAG: ATP-binding protein [Nitriliruptor sp.]
MSIPLHLAVHLAGVTVAAGLVLLVLLPPVAGPPIRSDPRSLPGRTRMTIAAGAGLLLISHLAVGSLVADAEGWPLLLRVAGYAALATGAAGGALPGRIRDSGGDLRAVAPLVLAAVAVPPLTVAAAFAGGAACVATARGVLGRGRQVALLAVGLALWAAGDLFAGDQEVLAAAASLAGSAAAGTWVLRRAARRSLAGRFTGVAVTTLLALVVGLGAGSGLVLASDVQAEQRGRLAAVAAAQAGDLVDRSGASLEATAAALAGATLVEALDSDDDEVADRRLAAITALPDVEVVVLTDATGEVVVAREGDASLAPAAGRLVAGAAPAAAALDGQLGRGVVDLGDGTLLVVGSVPVAPSEDGVPQLGRQVGTLTLGRELTSVPVIERVAEDTASDAVIVVGDEVAASTLPAAGASALAADAADGTVTVDGVERVVASAELGDPARGRLLLALPADRATDASETATRTAFLLAVIGLVLAGAVITVLSRRAAEPVSRLTVAAERVAAGDLGTRVDVGRVDEVGRLAAAFDGMTTSLEGRDRDLRASLAVQESLRDRLETVTASMGEALLATDAAGTLMTVNPAAAELLGAAHPEELLGRPLAEVLEGRAESGVDLVTALRTETDATPAIRGELARSGRVIEASSAPLTATDDGSPAEPGGRVYVVRDITARVLADRVRTELIANLSHELNTPLTPIKAFLEVLANRGGVEERLTPMLELAREGRARLEATIAALVDLAELEGGRTQVHLEPVAPNRVVADLLGRWRERVPSRTLTRNVRRGTPPVVADEVLVARVLDALVDNALKFSDGPVRISAEPVGDEVHLRVRDRGPGLPRARREEVFELFVQADGSSTRSVGGLGIGLPIAARVATLLGGRLELVDAPGGGTDAILVLPAVGEDRR